MALESIEQQTHDRKKPNSSLIGTFVVDDGPESVRIHKDAEEDAVETYFMDVYGVYKKTFGAKFVTLHNFNTWGIHAEDIEILAFQEIDASDLIEKFYCDFFHPNVLNQLKGCL